MTTIPISKKVNDLFRHHQFLNITLMNLDTPRNNLEKHFKKIYDSVKTDLLLDAFSPGKKFLIDKVALYDDTNRQTHYEVVGIRFISISKDKTKVKLGIPIEPWFHPLKTSSRRKPVPAPHDLSRIPVSLMRTPLMIEATFEITGTKDADIYVGTTIHEYYDALIQEQENEAPVQQAGGAKPKGAKPKGAKPATLAKQKKVRLDALKKQELIDRCRAKNISYSGRTKTELVAALRR